MHGWKWQPKWEEKELICTVSSVEEGLDRFYKRDRLHNLPDTRACIIADRKQDLEREGHAILASHHDSNTGTVLWFRPVGETLCVYSTSK